MATFLEVIGDASEELSLTRPATAFGNTEPDVAKLTIYLQRATEALHLNVVWQAERREQDFTAATGSVQPDGLPDDYGYFIPETSWDTTNHSLLIGPVHAVDWAALRARKLDNQADARRRFTVANKQWRVLPGFMGGEAIQQEYVTSNYIYNPGSGGVYKPEYTADDDVVPYDRYLLVLATKYIYLANNNLPAGAALMELQSHQDAVVKRDCPNRRILPAADIFSGNSRHSTGEPGAMRGLW